MAHIRGHLEDCPECFEAFDFHAELKTGHRRQVQGRDAPGLLARIEECLQDDIDGDGVIG